MEKEPKNLSNLTPKYVKDYYDKFLGKLKGDYSNFRWFSSEFTRFGYRQTKRAISQTLGKKEFNNILEVGCGDGVWTELLVKKCQYLTALDVSGQMIERIKKRLRSFSNIEFICADFLKNNLPPDKYDLILAIRSFEYFPNKQKAIEEIYRLLKRGGYALIITKNPHVLTFQKKKIKILHSDQIDIKLLKEMLLGKGFEIKKVYPAILGRKLSSSFSRVLFNIIHRISLSNLGWLIPSFFQKYFTESFLIFVKK